MSEPMELFVVEYSFKDQAWDVSSLAEAIAYNLSCFHHNKPTDLVILYIASSQAEAFKARTMLMSLAKKGSKQFPVPVDANKQIEGTIAFGA